MKIKKYIMALIVVAALLLAPALASAQYSDSISDPQGDVLYHHYSDGRYRWGEGERPDIDIIGAEIEREGDDILVSLEVVGSIRDEDNILYKIILEDEDQNTFTIDFKGGECLFYGPNIYDSIEYSGVGTSTFQTRIPLVDFDNPESLRIAEIYTWDWFEGEDEQEFYHDTAGPEADDPVNGNDNDNDETNGDFDFDFDEGLIDDLIARGMLCIALAIILPIIIVIILIVVVLKVLSKDDKGGEQPPQQQYQQPPPPSGPSQTQEQTQSGQGGTPPPPEDMNEE